MIDLPDHGYVDRQIFKIDAGGSADGSLGGASDYINRPGIRYSVRYTLPAISSSHDARILESLLDQGAEEDVSYPWPLDIRSHPAGAPVVDGSTAPGATIPVRGLVAGFQFRIGQPMAVLLADGAGFIHKSKEVIAADGSGEAVVPVFPLTRATFADGLVIEIERPRIRGVLSWEGSTQGAFGARPFSFTISERR